MRTAPGRRGRHALAGLAALVLFVAVVGVGEYVTRLESDAHAETRAGLQLREATAMRARIESELNATLHIAHGLSGILSTEALASPERIESALGALHRHARHLRNIGLAPDNVLVHLYPLAGNEAAVGIEYRDLPQQWPSVERAMRTGRQVLDGPVELVQGGRAVISRTPVFVEDGRYWGMLSLVLDIDALLDAAGFAVEQGLLRYALRAEAEGHGTVRMVAGDAALFDQTDAQRLDIAVPGGRWTLAFAAASAASPAGFLSHRRIVALGIALLLAALLYVLLEQRGRIAFLAMHDQLTGLPNRRLLAERLERQIARCQRRGGRFALLYLDLDGFKAVNDGFGHRSGDRALVEIATRLTAALRRNDTVARVGGDEFLVLLEDAADRQHAEAVASKLLDVVSRPLPGLGKGLGIGASVGVVLYPEDGTDADALLHTADDAMYADKRRQAQQTP